MSRLPLAALVALAPLAACLHQIEGPGAVPGDGLVFGDLVGDTSIAAGFGRADGALTPVTPHDAVVYLAVDGVSVARGPRATDNALASTSDIPVHDVDVPAFAHPDRDAALATVQATLARDFAGFDVTFTLQRPATGPYTMLVVGGRSEDLGLQPGYGGVAPLDFDDQNRSDVAFVFSALLLEYGYDGAQIAQVGSHELGHALGLEHVDRDADIMFPVACHCDESWGEGQVVDDPSRRQDDLAALARVLRPRTTPIDEKYAALGGPASLLGAPLDDETAAADGIGRLRRFEGGTIAWSPATGAFEVHGAILAKWTALGADTGLARYPVTDEIALAGGAVSHFEGASLWWSQATGAFEVHGAILARYREHGGADGALGYPTADEHAVDGGRRSTFERGAIVWSSATGEVVVTP